MKFEFSQDEATYLINVLAERPYKESAGLIAKMHEQAQGQIEAVKTDEDTADSGGAVADSV